MSLRFEWADRKAEINWHSPEELADLDWEGNLEMHYGISIMTGSNGTMLYGSVQDLEGLVTRIQRELRKCQIHEYAVAVDKERRASKEKNDG